MGHLGNMVRFQRRHPPVLLASLGIISFSLHGSIHLISKLYISSGRAARHSSGSPMVFWLWSLVLLSVLSIRTGPFPVFSSLQNLVRLLDHINSNRPPSISLLAFQTSTLNGNPTEQTIFSFIVETLSREFNQPISRRQSRPGSAWKHRPNIMVNGSGVVGPTDGFLFRRLIWRLWGKGNASAVNLAYDKPGENAWSSKFSSMLREQPVYSKGNCWGLAAWRANIIAVTLYEVDVAQLQIWYSLRFSSRSESARRALTVERFQFVRQ